MSDLTILATEMRNIGRRVLRNEVQLVREVALFVAEDLIPATPILTGQARRNWQTAINAPAVSILPEPATPSDGEAESMATCRSVVNGLRTGQAVHITNNVPYIVKLNSGYSQQAPSGFVQSTVLRSIQRIGRYNILTR